MCLVAGLAVGQRDESASAARYRGRMECLATKAVPGTEPQRSGLRLPRARWLLLATIVLIVAGVGIRFGVPIVRRMVAVRELDRIGTVSGVWGGPKWLENRIGYRVGRLFERTNYVSLLRESSATDAVLVHLQWLPDLESLDLKETAVTDAGLVHLQGLHRLEQLRISDNPITDAGLRHLKNLTSLQTLRLERTGVTDAGLAELEELTNLLFLWLDDTQVTDAGLLHLASLKKLRVVHLEGTQVTSEGISQLMRALPQVQVER